MATENAIIFINNYDSPKKTRLIRNNLTFFQSCKLHFSVKPYKVPKRIFSSLVPPFCGEKYQKIHVDLVGPLIALLSLVILLQYGHNTKNSWATSNWAPTDTLLGYVLVMPFLTYLFCRIAQSSISFIEIISILGYSLYGHILTLSLSLAFNNEDANLVFFICFMIFGGLSTLRIVVIFVACIPRPALRLIICSFVSIVQLLFLVFLHFLYMHKRFIYGAGTRFKM